MSYHRGGHPGAVAVSYNSTSTMAPLSPSRRYSGSNGSSAGGTSSTSSTSKYSYRPSGGDRPSSYYLSASTAGYRTSTFTSSSDSYRRPCISPARSVSSYNETGSIVGFSTGAGSLRYSSASSSSASSTTSSISSCGSRDRNGLHHPTPGSLATTTADLYAKYSPTNYVPNIYGSSSNNTTLIGNGHWRPSSSSSSSGVSGILTELHGGDEYDSCRDRRGRSYSSEASSGIELSSKNSSKTSVASPNLAERWSTRREAKRKTTQVPGTGGTVLAGHAQRDSAAAPTEDEGSRPTRNRLQSRRDERYGLNGLRNIGNTCFMNSVIQCLSNTRPLLEYLLNEQHLLDINTITSSMKGALIKAFGQVIHELWEMSGDHVVNTTALKSQIQRFAPRFMGYSQQDAQEFLRYLLEGLHEDVNRVTVKPQPILTDIPDHYSDSHKAVESWKRYLRSEDSTIVDVFVGQLRSSLHCTSCDHVSVTLDPFWDLSLPIPARSGTVKLNQCLEHFTKVETMDGDEKPTCSKCQIRRKCTKSFSIQKFPKILVIHLKRFSPTERFRGKLSVLVDFPLTGLDLSAFAAPSVQGCTYNLYGVANHSGTTYSGHYTAYCKHPYSGEWHEYNDNRVSTVPARSVVSSEAYVLFYEQQPLNPHL